MVYQQPIIMGLIGLTALLWYGWIHLREEHDSLALLMFGTGLFTFDILTYYIFSLIKADADFTSLSGIADTLLVVIIIISIIIVGYIVINVLWNALKFAIRGICKILGWRVPFK